MTGMKKYAADNLLFLREEYPEIYKLIGNRSANAELYRREEARNGQPNLVYCPEGQAPQFLYSRYDPGLEADRWAASMETGLKDAADVLVAGFGLGYHMAALLQAYPDKRFFVYEPDMDLFLHAIESVDLRPILASRQIAAIAVGGDNMTLTKLLVELFRAQKGGFAYAVLPFYRRIRPDLEQRLSDMIPRIAQSYNSDLITVLNFKSEFLENQIVNFERNLRTPSFFGLKDACRGMPAIIVGSGPSLGMAVEELRVAKRHALIIAAGSSVQGLLHYGIEPHLIVSIDPGEPNQKAFEKLDISHIPFLYAPTIKHTAIKDDESPYLLHAMYSFDVISQYLMDPAPIDGVLYSTSSVTGTAIQAAIVMGCTEIALIGQDFSFPNQQYYTPGVSHVPDLAQKGYVRLAKLSVPNVAGGVNPTNPNMLHLKHDVEEIIRTFPEIAFYNASPVGAVIEGTVHVKLGEWLEKHRHVSLENDWLRKRIRTLAPFPPDKIAVIAGRFGRMIREMKAFHESLLQVEEMLGIGNLSRPREEWFVRFERAWAGMVDHPLYKRVFSLFLMPEKFHMERNWEDMRKETDLAAKFLRLQHCVRPLVEGLKSLVPMAEERMKEVAEKLEKRYGVKV